MNYFHEAIGQKVMEKHERELYDKMIEKYEEENREKRGMIEAEKRRAVQLAEEEIRLKFEKQIETLRAECEQELQVVMNNRIYIIFLATYIRRSQELKYFVID